MGIRVEKFKFCSKANNSLSKKFFYFCLFCEFVNEDFKHMTTHIKQHFNGSCDIHVNTNDSIYGIKGPIKRNKVGKEFLDYWSEEFLCNQYTLRKKSQLQNKFTISNKAYIECPICMKACKLLDEQDHHFTSVKEFESHFWKHCLREKVRCKLCGFSVRSSEQQSHLDMNHSGFDNEKNEYFYDRNHQSSFKFLQGLKKQCLLFYDSRLCRQFGINGVPVVNVDKINLNSMRKLIYPNIFTNFEIKLQKFDNVKFSSNHCMNSDKNNEQVLYKSKLKAISDKSFNILSMGTINSKISAFVSNKDSAEGTLFKDKEKAIQVNEEICAIENYDNVKNERAQSFDTLNLSDTTDLDDSNEALFIKDFLPHKEKIDLIEQPSTVPNINVNIIEEDLKILNKNCSLEQFKHELYENLYTKYESHKEDNLVFSQNDLTARDFGDKKCDKLKCSRNENNQINIINVPDNFLYKNRNENKLFESTEQSFESHKASFHNDSSNDFNKPQNFTNSLINHSSFTYSGHDSPSSAESNFTVIPTNLMTPPPSNSSQDLVNENNTINTASLSLSFKERTIPNPYFQYKEQLLKKRDKRIRSKASTSVSCLSSIKTARCSNKRNSFTIRSFFYSSHNSKDPYHWIIENDDSGYIKNPFAVNKDRPVPLDEVTIMYLRVMSHHSPFETSELSEELTREDDDEISNDMLIGSNTSNDEGILNEFSEKAFFSLLSEDENNDNNN